MRVNKKDVSVIYNGVDVDLYREEIDNLAYRGKSSKEVVGVFASDY
ncbi:MAG: hypothetical protein QXF42_01120 [Sulfolobales archaeon]